jgi:hypothetical protein
MVKLVDGGVGQTAGLLVTAEVVQVGVELVGAVGDGMSSMVWVPSSEKIGVLMVVCTEMSVHGAGQGKRSA